MGKMEKEQSEALHNFKKKFIEEATDLINDLEKSLLVFEKDTSDKSQVEQIFRIMHSLKGSSAMFGYNLIDEFTHELETIYDLIRNGKLSVSTELLNVTLASVDHLKNLLEDEDPDDPDILEKHEQLLSQIKNITSGTENPVSEDTGVTSVVAGENWETYYIYFHPDEDILMDGTNPLYLMDEFHSIGKCIVKPHLTHIPELKKLDPDRCYISWEIILSTTEGVNAVHDIFIFVEDTGTINIQKLTDSNLVDIKDFTEKINGLNTIESEIGFTAIKDIADKVAEKNQELKEVKIKRNNRNGLKDNTISSIRVSSEKLDELMNLVSELVTNQASLSLLAEYSKNSEIIAVAESMEKISRRLRENTFSICLIPIETMVTRFQRLVRDLSSELNKEVDFITEGTETELDKNIIESLADPIMHILRNSLDHGIEEKSARKRSGKPERGKIVLKSFYSGMNVYIQIQDDGAGIDLEALRKKAVSKGFISEDSVLSEKELFDLVFMPGFSTAKKVTEVSGRGVGMDVVKRKISDIRGEVEIDSKKGVGTTITVKLPLTLSIIDGLLVKINSTHYVIPLPVVDKVYEIKSKKLKVRYSNMVDIDGKLIPYFDLRREFEYQHEAPDLLKLIVVKFDDKQVGITADMVIGEYQAVLKPLGKLFRNQSIISGATILGDGTVALVMDTNKIIEQFANQEQED